MFNNEDANSDNSLTIYFPLSENLTIITSVFGDSRQYAAVAINYGAITVWTAQLSAARSSVSTPGPIDVRGLIIAAGARVSLIVPTAAQERSVTFAAQMSAPHQSPRQYDKVIANWPLTSVPSEPPAE